MLAHSLENPFVYRNFLFDPLAHGRDIPTRRESVTCSLDDYTARSSLSISASASRSPSLISHESAFRASADRA
jgi:hypothetical protein